jgi:hypothetical protein
MFLILYRVMSSRCTYNPKMDIFTIGVIYSDLMKIPQGLIDNNYSRERERINELFYVALGT